MTLIKWFCGCLLNAVGKKIIHNCCPNDNCFSCRSHGCKYGLNDEQIPLTELEEVLYDS